jgi:hypothetical protein
MRIHFCGKSAYNKRSANGAGNTAAPLTTNERKRFAMADAPDITFLRECFSYNSETGVLVWMRRPISHFATDRICRLWNAKYANKVAGSANKLGYHHVTLTYEGKQAAFLVHRVAIAIETGEWPTAHVDHVNGNPSDNRLLNLRSATRHENLQNRGANKSNRLGLKGVFAHGKAFQAKIIANGKKYHLGTFETAEAAHEAYRAASTKLHGLFSRTH